MVVSRAMLLVAVLAGCTSKADDEAAATSNAQHYLQMACGEGDRGWSLLGGDKQAQSGDREAYLALAASSDCSRFTWQVGSAHCDDSACTVFIAVPDEASIPDFMAGSILYYREDHVLPGTNAVMQVASHGILGQTILVIHDAPAPH